MLFVSVHENWQGVYSSQLVRRITYHVTANGDGQCSIIFVMLSLLARDETRAWGFNVQHQEDSKQSASKTERWFSQDMKILRRHNFCHCYLTKRRNSRLTFFKNNLTHFHFQLLRVKLSRMNRYYISSKTIMQINIALLIEVNIVH